MTRALGVTSCILLKQRIRVDLPQPEGPMTAVMRLGATSRSTPRSAWNDPYQAFKSRTTTPPTRASVSETVACGSLSTRIS